LKLPWIENTLCPIDAGLVAPTSSGARTAAPLRGTEDALHQEMTMKLFAAVAVLIVLSSPAKAQQPAGAQPAPTDRTKSSYLSAAELSAALAKLPTDRPAGSVRVFSLAPYNVNVERRMPLAQGASVHEAQAELFYVVDGSATLLTGGKLEGETRNGTNLQGKSIAGGTAQKFGKGDFMIVPSGVPHQFVDIQSPVVIMSLYFPDVK
jgi:mannose-6-phosphate isomerase-like protein (cupin superfamily)